MRAKQTALQHKHLTEMFQLPHPSFLSTALPELGRTRCFQLRPDLLLLQSQEKTNPEEKQQRDYMWCSEISPRHTQT